MERNPRSVRPLFSIVAVFQILNASVTHAQQPGFDCAAATTVDEITICGNAALSQLDRQLETLYVALRENLTLGNRTALRDTQRFWLQKRNACGQNTQCIANLYRGRIPQLQALLSGGTASRLPSTPVPDPGTQDACSVFPTLCPP
jgi:uncharacterized protein